MLSKLRVNLPNDHFRVDVIANLADLADLADLANLADLVFTSFARSARYCKVSIICKVLLFYIMI